MGSWGSHQIHLHKGSGLLSSNTVKDGWLMISFPSLIQISSNLLKDILSLHQNELHHYIKMKSPGVGKGEPSLLHTCQI